MKAVIGDIHGAGNELAILVAMLRAASYDELYCVGDLFDRGPNAHIVWQAITYFDIKCTLGNHERKMLQFLKGERDNLPAHYYYALDDLRHHKVKKSELIQFLTSLPLLIPLETEHGKVIIAHAGIDPENPFVERLWKRSSGFLKRRMVTC